MDTQIIGILLCNIIYPFTVIEGAEFDKRDLGITNANLTDFPIPADTSIVWLQNNQITYVPINYFKNVSSRLVIKLYNNEISDIQDLAFAAAPTVVEIALNNNKLSIIKKLMFSGLPHLAVLNLHGNKIHTLEPDCFKENSALQDLTLNNNKMERFPRCIFDQEHHPTLINHLVLHTNPLMCDSSWCWVRQAEHDWIILNWEAGMVCHGPGNLTGWTWNSLTTLDLCTGRKG